METYDRYIRKRRRRKRALINRVFLLVNIVILIINIVLVVKIIDANNAVEANANEGDSTTKVADNGNNQTTSGNGNTTDSNKDEESTTGPITEDIIIEVGRDDFGWTSNSTDTKKVIDLEYMNQNDYPTGCESVTTWMALNYMGYDVSVDMFIDNYLDKFSIRWGENVMFGENPREYFIGNPRNSSSYGCYAPVIKKALVKIAGENSVHDLSGMNIDKMIEEYVSKGVPVILWATMDMEPSRKGNSWYIERTNETYTWIAGEHCLLLAGWDESNYYFYDPFDNHGVIAYEKSLVTKRYAELGRQALALVKVSK